MERLLLGELMKWREKTDRKPLILRGARQVGKTWLLKEFGRKCFRDVCYINFEQQTLLAHLFETTLSPHDHQTAIAFIRPSPRLASSHQDYCRRHDDER